MTHCDLLWLTEEEERGCRRTSRASWIPWNVWLMLSYVHFPPENKIKNFYQILKAFSRSIPLHPTVENHLSEHWETLKDFQDWYDLICVLEQTLVTVRSVKCSFYIRRIHFNTQSTYPISIKFVTDWHPQNIGFPISVWH